MGEVIGNELRLLSFTFTAAIFSSYAAKRESGASGIPLVPLWCKKMHEWKGRKILDAICLNKASTESVLRSRLWGVEWEFESGRFCNEGACLSHSSFPEGCLMQAFQSWPSFQWTYFGKSTGFQKMEVGAFYIPPRCRIRTWTWKPVSKELRHKKCLLH